MRNHIRFAWGKATHAFGGWSLVVMTLAVPLAGFSIQYLVDGPKEAMDEFQTWIIYGLAAVGCVFLAVFLGSLVYSPFHFLKVALRDEQVAHAHTKTQLSERLDRDSLREYVLTAEKFTLRQLACLLAGEPYTGSELTGAAAFYFEQLAEWSSQDGSPLVGKHHAELRSMIEMHRLLGGRWPDAFGDAWLPRSDAKHYAQLIGVRISGLTDEDQGPQEPRRIITSALQ